MTQSADGTAAPAQPLRVKKFNPKKSFSGSNAVDKMKAYLRDVPVLHKRLVNVIGDLEQTLAGARAAKERLETVTGEIEDTVKRWEEEQQNDGASQPAAAPGEPGGTEGPPAGPPADQPVGDAPPPGAVQPPAGSQSGG